MRSTPAWKAPPDAGGEDGFLTIQQVWVVATSLVLLTLVANVVVVQYAHAVIRTAVDEAARAGARVLDDPAGAVAACQTAADATRRDLLAGRLGEHVTIACTAAPTVMRASASGSFPAWLPGVPPWTVRTAAVAVQERSP